jgi:hypothetical protein
LYSLKIENWTNFRLSSRQSADHAGLGVSEHLPEGKDEVESRRSEKPALAHKIEQLAWAVEYYHRHHHPYGRSTHFSPQIECLGRLLIEIEKRSPGDVSTQNREPSYLFALIRLGRSSIYDL